MEKEYPIFEKEPSQQIIKMVMQEEERKLKDHNLRAMK
jgi:hypothetical protein